MEEQIQAEACDSKTVVADGNRTRDISPPARPFTAYHAHDDSIPSECDLCILDDHRLFYIHHPSRTSHWEPPWAAWHCRLGLPYGWEQAIATDGHFYYIDHIARYTTYSDPRRRPESSVKRIVTIQRDPEIGFGFVAAGQQPTIVQFVSPEGPSDGKLFSDDEIICIDGVDVRDEEKESVVQRVRAAAESITLTVQQTKRSPRRQCRVRFTESVQISSPDSYELPPPIPNVLRVFLENGQTRSFKYDDVTTVEDICGWICDKLQITARNHFALALEYSLGTRTCRLTLLTNHTKLHTLSTMPNAAHLRCVFRFAFVPSDAFLLLKEDPKAFDYFYSQCVNDVVSGRFVYEMRYEACMRLAALHIQEQWMNSDRAGSGQTPVSLTRIQKEIGLATFLPAMVLENVKRKEIRRHLRYFIDRDSSHFNRLHSNRAFLPESINCWDKATVLRLKYVHIVCRLPSFGGREYSATFKGTHMEMTLQIDPKSGILIKHPGKDVGRPRPTLCIAFELISRLVVYPETEILTTVSIHLNNGSDQGVEVIVDRDGVSDMCMIIYGYHRLATGAELPCDVTDEPPNVVPGPSTQCRPYEDVHVVVPSGWNYSGQASPGEKIIDLSAQSPPYSVASTFSAATPQPTYGSGETRTCAGDSSEDTEDSGWSSPLRRSPTDRVPLVKDDPSDEEQLPCTSYVNPIQENETRGSFPSPLYPPIDGNTRKISTETLVNSCTLQVDELQGVVDSFPDSYSNGDLAQISLIGLMEDLSGNGSSSSKQLNYTCPLAQQEMDFGSKRAAQPSTNTCNATEKDGANVVATL